MVEISDAVPAPATVKPVPDGDVPADIDEAGALASGLAGQIIGSGSQASSAHSPLSPEMALKLTQPSGVLDHDSLEDVRHMLGGVDRVLEALEQVLPADHDHRVDTAVEQ